MFFLIAKFQVFYLTLCGLGCLGVPLHLRETSDKNINIMKNKKFLVSNYREGGGGLFHAKKIKN